MEKKIRVRMLLVGGVALLLAVAASLSAYYISLRKQTWDRLYLYGEVVTNTTNLNQVLQNLPQDIRVTIITQWGKVVYDNKEDIALMDNHAMRPEFRKAQQYGEGYATRSMGIFGQRTWYYAVRQKNNAVVRISVENSAMWQMVLSMAPLLAIAAVLIFSISLVLSTLISRSLVHSFRQTIENAPDAEPMYPEFKPILDTLQKQWDAQEKALQLRYDFTVNVSHELKTPLTSISGYAEMIKTGMAKPEDVKSFAGKIYDEAGRMINLVKDIVRLNELDSQDDLAETPLFDLYEVVENVIETLDFAASSQNILLETDGCSAHMHGDRRQIEELVYNLVDNAIRYNKPGGIVSIRTSVAPHFIRLSVVDTGIGIPKEHQQKIFERFYRVDKSHSRQTGGTGLGLAIVEYIARRHHAEITLKSELDKGTRIDVTFPT